MEGIKNEDMIRKQVESTLTYVHNLILSNKRDIY